MNLIRKSIPHSGSIKTKLFDRFMNRRAKLWNDNEITTTLTAPGTIFCWKKDMEQNTWENLCEDTYKQVWLS